MNVFLSRANLLRESFQEGKKLQKSRPIQHRSLTLWSLIAFLLIASACEGAGTTGGSRSPRTPGTQATPGIVYPTGTQSTQATPPAPPSPASLVSSSPVPQALSLLTDRSDYQPADTVKVTFTNTSSITLYAWDTRASCSIFDLEVLTQGKWQQASAARCSLGRPAFMITLEPGEQYHTNIQAQTPGLTTAPFPTGTYRVTLSYATVPAIQMATNQVFSASFQIRK